MRWAILAVVVAFGLVSEAAAQSVTASGIYAGFPHNVHDTRVFNGTWTAGSPMGGIQVTATPLGAGRNRVAFWRQMPSGAWSASFTVDVPPGGYQYRTFTYAPFSGVPIAEPYPPVVIQVN